MSVYKHIPNLVTLSRIIFVLLSYLTKEHYDISMFFFILAVLSDGLDGYLARKLKLSSTFGAYLDSFADVLLTMYIFYLALKMNGDISKYYLWIGLIVFVRLTNLGIMYCKFKRITIIHTVLNKMSGVMLYAIPLFMNSSWYVYLLCILSLVASLEESFIILKSKSLDLNIKSIFTF